MVNRRVVVTGVGAICGVGSSVPEIWRNVVAGCSGVAGITRFDPEGYETRFAAEVKGFNPAEAVGRKESRRMDRFTQLAVVATQEALASAGFAVTPENATRVGVLIGTGMGGMETLEQGTETVLGRGPRRLTPFFMPMMLANMASGTVSIVTGAKGPNFAPVSACAASAHAIGEAARIVRGGLADVMIAGGAEAPITRMGVAGFNAMDALSTRNDDPVRASRPFDADRDGFVLGEGGAVVILESWEHAEGRGATILGEIAGYATTDDANHMVQPAPGGEGAARAMQLALADAGLTAEDVDYVNAHGTSTQLNEKLETQALQRVFGERTKQVPVSSTKSMTGHLLGAAGAIEAVICLQALATGIAPPTINQERPDPECDLDTVPNQARELPMRTVMSNSMGFGGHNVSLIFARDA